MIKSSGKFILHDGFSIAYQRWRREGAKPLLAMHGWLDNSNSFTYLGEILAGEGYDVVATDHAGHGHSSHAPFGCVLSPSSYVEHALCVMNALNWPKCHVVGHSMGAIVSVSLAASFSERVDKLVLIEGLGKGAQPTNCCIIPL
jgi:pimeloyl-ACP methyl ester carboxylesterase